jgi:hypothetical protein
MSKGILFLTSLQYKPVKKDRLFYDQFEYCLGFYLDEVSCLRVLDHAHIDDIIERRKVWREIAQQRWVNGRQKHGIIISRRWKDITEKTSVDLHALAEMLLNAKSEFKLVVSLNQGYVYSNDLELLDQLDHMPELEYKSYTQAKITRPKNTIKLQNPKHKFRSYFKHVSMNSLEKDQFMDFLHNQRNHVRVSTALQRWIDGPFNRTQDYFFVDHDSESWLTMLSLVSPGIIRKTMHIIPDK